MANLGHPHLNARGEVCYCGFGKNQPQLDWHLGAAQVVEENHLPADPKHEPGRPFVYDPEENTVTIGPEGGSHWHLIESHPHLEEQPMGRLNSDSTIDWFIPPMAGQHEAEEALGAQSTPSTNFWNTEPMRTEPDDEQRHHEVQISNDEPGVPTIGS